MKPDQLCSRAEPRARTLWFRRALPFLSVLLLPALAFALDAEVAHEEAHGDGHSGQGEHGWDTTALVASFVNFVILIGVFVYLFKDKLNVFLRERKAEVANALSEAARLKAEAEAKHKEYTERMAKLDQELAQIKQDVIAAGIKERDRIMAEAEHKAARMRQEAHFLVEQQVKQLRGELAREAIDGAIAAAEALLLKSTTSYDQQRLAQDYLNALSNNQGEKKTPSIPSFGTESHA
jgi:F0F1-type ATP synthase membrane subunit b/b'